MLHDTFRVAEILSVMGIKESPPYAELERVTLPSKYRGKLFELRRKGVSLEIRSRKKNTWEITIVHEGTSIVGTVKYDAAGKWIEELIQDLKKLMQLPYKYGL